MQYRERIIFIGQKIDEEFGNKMVATMLYLDSESTKVRAWRAGGRAGARGGRAWSGVVCSQRQHVPADEETDPMAWTAADER